MWETSAVAQSSENATAIEIPYLSNHLVEARALNLMIL